MQISDLKPILQRQFGAALDMLEKQIRNCPDELWTRPLWENSATEPGFSDFWYIAFHSLFFLDLYLFGSYEGFQPPEPFTLDELNPAGVLPERIYSREELLDYLKHCRRKCEYYIGRLTEQRALDICRLHWGDPPYLELLIDNIRHVQEHNAQLGLFLGQHGIKGKWVSQAK